jgi:hypothetical protein
MVDDAYRLACRLSERSTEDGEDAMFAGVVREEKPRGKTWRTGKVAATMSLQAISKVGKQGARSLPLLPLRGRPGMTTKSHLARWWCGKYHGYTAG